MDMITVHGSSRDIGRAHGEQFRESIQHTLEVLPLKGERYDIWRPLMQSDIDIIKQYLPEIREELEGLAEGADISLETVYWLNTPPLMYDDTRLDNQGPTQGCTNIAVNGPDGPLLGKNNDGSGPTQQLDPIVIVSYPDKGMPMVRFGGAGMLGGDAFNAEGLATGGSSTGSAFQQSASYVPIRLWHYEGSKHCKTTREYVDWMKKIPLRGKGQSSICIDKTGVLCSLEAPCPLLQIRTPKENDNAINCVNYFQLPQLKDADRRHPEMKQEAQQRAAFLGKMAEDSDKLDLNFMIDILNRHKPHATCQHIGRNLLHTEYSFIAKCAEVKFLYLKGHPCENSYKEYSI